MTTSHILDIIGRAATWRAMHGVSPMVAALIAAAVFAVALYGRRRR